MQGMISRYRDRLSNSTSEIKALSASREKSISNNNNSNVVISNGSNNNNIQTQSILVMNTNPSTESLNKYSKQTLQQSMAGKVLATNQLSESIAAESNVIVASSLKQLPHNNKYNLTNTTISNNPSCLPPQPNLTTHTKQRLKQSSVSISTPHDNALKSSKKTINTTTKQSLALAQTANKKTKQKQKQLIKQVNRQKQRQAISRKQRSKSKSKSKKHSILSNKKTQIVQLTAQQLTQSFSQSIYDVFANELKQRNVAVNNSKDGLKLKISILLQQYWEKRCEISQREKEMQQEYEYHQHEHEHQHQQIKMNNQLPMAQSITNNNNNNNPFTIIPHTQHTPPQLSSFTTQLQRRFFETQKQRQFLQKKLQSLTKKLQSMSRQLQRYVKLEKLVNNTIESENQTRREVVRLRKELEYSELKNSQQQKIWRKETMEISQIIQGLKQQLREKYNDAGG